MTSADLAAVQGVPQTVLDADTAARLPHDAPSAPWTATMRGVLWAASPTRTARTAAGPVGARGLAMIVVGGLIEYGDTPVGPYHEVIGGVGILTLKGLWTTVPFIAVDSLASVVGGRRNWALPKTVASFEGDLTATMAATGPDWSIQTRVTPLGPTVPFRTSMQLRQPRADGDMGACTVRASARVRPAWVRVRVQAADTLSGWLRTGRYLGIVMESASGDIGLMTSDENQTP